MAHREVSPESQRTENRFSYGETTDDGQNSNLECAVCLQPCIHPAKLPCGHIFCFLCVKGIANQSKRCAMCRQEIPQDFTDNPELIPDDVCPETVLEDGQQWFYEGRNGWWQYDERTSVELEIAYKKKEKKCEVLIAGFLYIVDFEDMVQMRRSDPSRRRRIKRDLANIPKKGIAGIRLNLPQEEVPSVQTVERSLQVTDDTTVSSEVVAPCQVPDNKSIQNPQRSDSEQRSTDLEEVVDQVSSGNEQIPLNRSEYEQPSEQVVHVARDIGSLYLNDSSQSMRTSFTPRHRMRHLHYYEEHL